MKKEWKLFYRILGKKYRISGRVLHHIRNSYHDKYSDKTHEEALLLIRRAAQKKLTLIKQAGLPHVIRVVGNLTHPILGLTDSDLIIRHVNSELHNALGTIDKIGFNESLIRFTNRVKDEEIKEIIEADYEDIVDPEPIKR